VPYFTIGQRRGLGINNPSPLYVVALDASRCEVVVGDARELHARAVEVGGVHLISGEPVAGSIRVMAKVRYAQAATPATVDSMAGDRVRLCFDESQRAVAPGQAAVFYDAEDSEVVLGGGTILKCPETACRAPQANDLEEE
jgi:tRNA-specific 2-thiouridylase